MKQKLRGALAGLTPGNVALIVSLGIVLGSFPVFGVPTVMCVVAAIVFRLNIAALQIVNQVCSPLQYAMVVPLARLGGGIVGARAGGSVMEFVVSGTRNAIIGWFCVCVPLGLALYFLIVFLQRAGVEMSLGSLIQPARKSACATLGVTSV